MRGGVPRTAGHWTVSSLLAFLTAATGPWFHQSISQLFSATLYTAWHVTTGEWTGRAGTIETDHSHTWKITFLGCNTILLLNLIQNILFNALKLMIFFVNNTNFKIIKNCHVQDLIEILEVMLFSSFKMLS